MNNYQKLKKDLSIENARFILSELPKPQRCIFCNHKSTECNTNDIRLCIDGIDIWLRKEVNVNEESTES